MKNAYVAMRRSEISARRSPWSQWKFQWGWCDGRSFAPSAVVTGGSLVTSCRASCLFLMVLLALCFFDALAAS